MKSNRAYCLVLALMLLTLGCRKTDTGIKPSLHKLDMVGDVQKIQSRLARGADINEKDKWGDTPLVTYLTMVNIILQSLYHKTTFLHLSLLLVGIAHLVVLTGLLLI